MDRNLARSSAGRSDLVLRQCPSGLIAARPFAHRRHALRSRLRPRQVPYAGLLDFLPASQPKQTPETERLVGQLITLSEGTNAGAKASQSLREEIDGVAEQLKRFRIRNPTKSTFFWGQFEALYCSKAVATGGPFVRGPIGQALPWGQEIRQNLIQPSTYQNCIKFRGLGFLPGEAKQAGTITAAGGNGFKVMLEAPTIKLGEGQEKPQSTDQYPVERRFEVLYLDEQVKIIRFLPEEVDKETVLFVQRRVPAAVEAAEPEAPAPEKEEGELVAEADNPFPEAIPS